MPTVSNVSASKQVRERDIIYFDNNATTKISPEVFEAMVPYLTECYGNPSSAYGFGRQVAGAIKTAREQTARLLGCSPREVVFTSCGTESDNTAIASALLTTGKRHIITSKVEHSAIKNQVAHLERSGYAVTRLGVDEKGLIRAEQVAEALRPDTAIVSLMWANNETGVLFPIEEIGRLCRERGVLFHTDAVQAVGKIPFKLSECQIDFLSLSGHKLHAPKGVGALYVRSGVPFVPHLIGGGQEKGKRGGTENVASLVGLGEAAAAALEHVSSERVQVRALRDAFEKGVLEAVPGTRVNGDLEKRLPNTSSICFSGLEAEGLLLLLDRECICASAGSACTTGTLEPSHVLSAMGMSSGDALASIRFSFSTFNMQAEVDRALAVIKDKTSALRVEATPA
jgi:cysteine desulfurase